MKTEVLNLELADEIDWLKAGEVSGSVLKTYNAKDAGNLFVIVRLENQILGYEYSKIREKFEFRWRKNMATSSVDDALKSYPLWTFDLNNDGVDEMIIREQDGLKVYKMIVNDSGFELLGKNNLFHDAYGKNQNVSIGKFYVNQKFVGLMRRDKSNVTKFYVFKSDCFGKSKCEILKPLTTTFELSKAWTNSETRFYLTKLMPKSSQEMFALRTQNGLEFYEFNKKYQIEKLLEGNFIENSLGSPVNDERIFFGTFTNNDYQDVLHLNTSGLFLYQFDIATSDYTMLNYAPQFSSASGWTNENSNTFFVDDFDGDNKSDIIFTGVNGITLKKFDVNSGLWEDLAGQISQAEKFSKAVGTAKVNEKPIVFLQTSDGALKLAKISSQLIDEPKATAKSITSRKKAKLPEGSLSVYDIEQTLWTPIAPASDLRWTEQWAGKFEDKFIASVPNGDGVIEFNVPLVEVCLSQYLKVQLSLSYSDQTQNANMVGAGWNLPLLNNHIQVDHQCSVFTEDSIFSFHGMGQRIILKRETSMEIESSGIMRFTIPGQDDTSVHYRTGENSYWKIETPTERFIYGQDEKGGVVQMNLSWENYRCGKTDTQNVKQIPVAWFIKERHDKTAGKSIYYRYNAVMKPIVPNGRTYTYSVTLKSINDEKKALVYFSYAAKASSEYTASSVINKDKIAFPIPLSDENYLTKISVRAENYSQTFMFNYKLAGNGKERLLIGLNQSFADDIKETILKMNYVKIDGQTLIKSVDLPRGSNIAFEYEKLTRGIPKGAMIKTFPVSDKPSMTPGADYKVIAFTRGESVKLRIHDGVDEDVVLDFFVGVSKFEYQVITATSSMFLILITTENHKELVVYRKQDSGWSDKLERHKLSKDVTVHLGEKFIGFFKPMSEHIKIFQWNSEVPEAGLEEKNLNAPNNRPMLRLFSQGRMFIAYDDSHLIVFYLDVNSQWRTKKVKEIKNYDSATRNFIELFEIDEGIKKQLIESVKENLFQVDGNQIVLTKLQESGGTLSVVINMMLLNANYEVNEQIETINRENVFNFVHDETQANSKFRLKYSRVDGKFAIRLHDIIAGDLHKELNKVDPSRRSSEKARMIKEFNNAPNWKDFFKKIFLLDWKKYHARLTPSGVLSGEDNVFQLTGIRWENKKTSTESVASTFNLGQNLVVEQSDHKTNELTFYEIKNKQRIEVHKMNIEGEFVNIFPVYLAYQATPNDINVLTFTPEKTLGPIATIHGAKLLHGDFNGMTTLVNSTSLAHTEPQEILYRPLADIILHTSEYVISKRTLKSGDLTRSTGYERSFDLDEDGNVSEKFVMIPGGVKNQNGWYEEIKSMNNSDKVITREKKVFHASGDLKSHQIVEDKFKNQMIDKKGDEPDLSQKIMDKSKTFEIADLNPNKVNDEDFAYFGFETYENNSIGDSENKNTWEFQYKNVVRKAFSLTGESFLRLVEDGESLETTITPKNQKGMFVSSCWIRTNVEMTINQKTKIFEANIANLNEDFFTVQAEVKRQVGEWSYLEILIDFKTVGVKYKEFMRSKKKPSAKNPHFKIDLIVSNIDEGSVDIDHIRFFPITHEFIVDVFNPLGQVTATINPNGSIKRKLYNKYQQEIATIDEDGNVVDINSKSETGKYVVPLLKEGRPNLLIFKSTENKFHDPIEWWKNWNISGVGRSGSWSFAPGQLRHKVSQPHRVVIPSSQINMSSNVIRFDYALNSYESMIKFSVKGQTFIELTKFQEIAELSIKGSQFKLPSNGEFIIAVEQSRLIVWIDGVLLTDSGSSVSFNDGDLLTLEIAGSVALENFIALNKPSLTVEYFNSWGEPTQIINLESDRVAQVTETLHDNLGRRTITTKPTRMIRNESQSVVAFYEEFISNDNYDDPKSVWFTHHLKGDVNKLNPKCEGFPYKRTEFEKNPSRDKQAVGLPGKEFSVIGPYSKKIKSETDIPFLLNLFPVSRGFTMYTKVTENGSKKVSVFDFREKKVADYVRVPGFDHILSINEYDTNGRIVKMLPPLFHEKANTVGREDPWNFGNERLTEEEKNLQQVYGSHFDYDVDGNLIKKSTPDGGVVEYVYDESGNRRFMKLSDDQVVYFLYDDAELLIETGHLKKSLDIETLKSLASANELPTNIQKIISQELGYSNKADDPQDRKASKKFVTHNENDEVSDEVKFDLNNHVTRKTTKSSSESAMNVEKTYAMNKLATLTYPRESDADKELSLIYTYDKRGLLTSIGTKDEETHFAKFTYTSDGQLESEKIQPNSQHEYIRSYDYVTAGYLEKISDPFLTEEMTYTSDGYGQKGFGDGVISSTTFKSTWASKVDPKHFKVNKSELVGDKKLLARCFRILQQAGYLTSTAVVEKSLTFKTEDKLPMECKGSVGYQIAKLMAKKQVPKFYGHRYAYGNHQELTKAKYFTDDSSTKSEPLHADSFSKSMTNLSVESSLEVWKILAKGGFIVSDQPHVDLQFAIGKQGKESFIRLKEIENELNSLASPSFDAMRVVPEIVNVIIKSISKKEFTTEESFDNDFLAIHGFPPESRDWQVVGLKKISKIIFNKLSAKKLLPIYPQLLTPLNSKLVISLKKFMTRIPEILTVLNSHYATDIGESPFDLYSYNIDANGNHRLFYNGYQRFGINYDGETNRIENIQLDDVTFAEPQKSFSVAHDENGNIVKALHKNIEKIEYFTTTQRTKKITMTDGRVLKFYYDVLGERILKQVFNASGELTTSTKYVRDEAGRVLFDKKTVYKPKPQPAQILTTKYIYGPRGLIGFIRNEEFFSVMTDHAGSIKLVIKNGEVVASYDYLPYGDLMRKFVTNPEHEITYRFTGQEFDEETGLYNYHARLYDPSIGRFYQIDPQGQSFSPYVYSGNSPISFVDPDGEIFFLIAVVVLAVGGAYLGGAKANNQWNPAKWDWKSADTYLGMVGGAVGEFIKI